MKNKKNLERLFQEQFKDYHQIQHTRLYQQVEINQKLKN